MTDSVVCNFAVLRYLPDRICGEFVNVGVVMFWQGHFDFRVEHQNDERIAAFFRHGRLQSYRTARESFLCELGRIKRMFDQRNPPLPYEHQRVVFRELVRPRESILRFGEIGTLVTHNPGEELEKLFGRYVTRHYQVEQETSKSSVSVN